MDMNLIKTEEQYDKIMGEVLALAKTNPKPETEDYEKLMLLSMLIKLYDDEHYPTPPSDPVEAIKFRMDQMGLKPVDMKEVFGTTSRYYEVVNKKRNLSFDMAKKLNETLKISYDVLIGNQTRNTVSHKVVRKRVTPMKKAYA